MRNVCESPLVVLLALIVASGTVMAQQVSGDISGQIVDQTGARIASAKVIVQAAGSSLSATTQADSEGRFRVGGLLPGTYKVSVSAAGFADVHDENASEAVAQSMFGAAHWMTTSLPPRRQPVSCTRRWPRGLGSR